VAADGGVARVDREEAVPEELRDVLEWIKGEG
jgi:hypothetical protein